MRHRNAVYAEMKTKAQAFPSEQAPRVHMQKTVAEVEAVLREMMNELLECLSRVGEPAS